MNNPPASFYGGYLQKLEAVESLMLSEIGAILKAYSDDSESALAEHIKSRIKNENSLKEKLRRRDLPVTVESGLTNLSDVVGVRIITHFVGDIYTILEEIEKSPSWQVIETKDYIASPKPNGYRSLHILISVPFGDEKIERIMTEIQLRTIAMDCWASLEHQLKYKKNIQNTSLIVSELKRCADEMASTDLSMQTIRDLIHKDDA